MAEMTSQERGLAVVAAAHVLRAGGTVTFDQFDRLMAPERYVIPLSWMAGWGLSPAERKANADKLCAFAACKQGWLRQTDTGYEVTEQVTKTAA